MRKLLLQLDSSRLPSVFDRVVAYDAGADEILSYGGITAADVRDLIYGCIFTRGPKDLKNTAVFIGGADMAAGEQLLAAARKTLFQPFTVSLMLDSNGSNTTAVAAVAKLLAAAGDVRRQTVVVVAGTGPVGIRAAGLFAAAGAEVVITSRKREAGDRARDLVRERFGGTVRAVTLAAPSDAAAACEGATVLLNAGPAGVMLVPRQAWAHRPGLRVVADVNAVPPLGVEGIGPTDDGMTKDGVVCFGALAIGNLKMKVHKACIARLFERNDLVLDAETIADVARELMASQR
ncbi:MAG TPA: NAD(P)-dependent methylenetetrahydromethanopterin dehydrogenase [Gemmatimonadales bacterium]|nr:NAD(P)-dependent methylenetetrahydromethanopterin dehydrogenase [Gemmatimonadales bacterium]